MLSQMPIAVLVMMYRFNPLGCAYSNSGNRNTIIPCMIFCCCACSGVIVGGLGVNFCCT